MNSIKNVAIIPTSDHYLMDRLFDDSLNRDDRLLPNILLKSYLNKKKINVHTIDYYKDYSEIDVVVFERIDYEFIYYFHYRYKNKLIILIPWEPEVVSSDHRPQSLIRISHCFDYILTWNDLLVDKIQFYKLSYPHSLICNSFQNDLKSFESRKLLVQISSNLNSKNNLELYSLRKEFNFKMSQLIPNQFDFYGKGWSNSSSYKGVVENKFDTLSKYKFSLCFENMKNGQGYITEKIFDCFRAGVVPIYFGSDNVTDYIPSNCFIDFREFRDPNLLLEFIQNMDYKTWQAYLLSAKLYLKSELSQKFSVNQYIETFYGAILKDKYVHQNGTCNYILLTFRYYQSKFIKRLKKNPILRYIKKSLFS